MTDREVQLSLPEEVARRLTAALTQAAPRPAPATDRDQALARIEQLAGGAIDPTLLAKAYELLGHGPGRGAPHAGAA
ncbi:hypothetical protein [Nocardia sp. IFM 10818]